MKRIATGIVALLIAAGATSCSSTPAPAPEAPAPAASSPAAELPAPPPEDTTTPGQKNALRAAEQYLQSQAFSKVGLGKQLEYNEYAAEDINYALENVTADWMEQAARKAKAYVDIMPFSRAQLTDQLVFDGFTPAEAEHGVTAAGL